MTSGTTENESRSSLFRNLLKGTALYSVALFGQRVASILLLPINTRFLNPTDFGVLELLEQIVVILTVFVGGNTASSLGYFYFERDDPKDRGVVVSTTIIGCALIGSLAAAIGILFADPIGKLAFGRPDYRPYLLLLFTSLPLSFCMEAGFCWLRVADRPGMFALASLLRVLVTIVATLALVAGLKLGVLGVLSSSVIAIGIVALALIVYCFREIPPRFQWPTFWRMFRFSIPLSLGSIAMFVIHFGDRFILPHYRPLADLGIYGIAYKMGMMVSLVSSSFNTYWTAQVFQVARRDDAAPIIGRIFTYVFLVLAVVSLGIVVLSRPALQILTTPKFVYAATLVPLIVGAYFVRSIAEFFRCFFLVEGRPEFEAICNWVGAAVCLAGYFVLIPRYGIWGAGSATALAFLVIAVLSVFLTYHMTRWQFELTRLVKIVVVSAALLAAYLLVPVQTLPAQILWAMLLIAAFPTLLWISGFVLPGEVEQSRSLLTSAGIRARRLFGERWRHRPRRARR